ncbi:hypothetical protein [Cryobacterium lyxosi]|uniref:Uncharacterized protein n=1 Tax=Cryobacterium lyxosi TaxID=1259228 RepID=A0A4R8Z9B8_9MICO|nr:hypothetical protein [Cryobacterium lyxosi]TFD23136.1 hypothetical protein E3T27_15725 [Cryobacterium lyxosi]
MKITTKVSVATMVVLATILLAGSSTTASTTSSTSVRIRKFGPRHHPGGALDQQNNPSDDYCAVRRSHEYAPAADLTPDTKSARITPLPAQTLEVLRRRREVLREFSGLLK